MPLPMGLQGVLLRAAVLFLLITIVTGFQSCQSFDHKTGIRCKSGQISTFSLSASLQQGQQGSATNTGESKRSTTGAVTEADLQISVLTMNDFIDIFNLAGGQFAGTCDTFVDLLSLYSNIIQLFIPKLLWPDYTGHYVLGLKDARPAPPSDGSLLARLFPRRAAAGQLRGFVDVSLQPSSGSLEALSNEPLHRRVSKQKALNSARLLGESGGWSPASSRAQPSTELRPYVCNLLVDPSCRGLGYGRQLMVACEEQSAAWGQTEVFLHVEPTSLPALALYLGRGYDIVRTISTSGGHAGSATISGGSVLYMRKQIVAEASGNRV